MAKYEITFKCGCVKTVNIGKTIKTRQERADWLTGQICYDCQKKKTLEVLNKEKHMELLDNTTLIPDVNGIIICGNSTAPDKFLPPAKEGHRYLILSADNGLHPNWGHIEGFEPGDIIEAFIDMYECIKWKVVTDVTHIPKEGVICWNKGDHCNDYKERWFQCSHKKGWCEYKEIRRVKCQTKSILINERVKSLEQRIKVLEDFQSDLNNELPKFRDDVVQFMGEVVEFMKIVGRIIE